MPNGPGCWDFCDWHVDQNGWQGDQEGRYPPDPHFPSFPIAVCSHLQDGASLLSVDTPHYFSIKAVVDCMLLLSRCIAAVSCWQKLWVCWHGFHQSQAACTYMAFGIPGRLRSEHIGLKICMLSDAQDAERLGHIWLNGQVSSIDGKALLGGLHTKEREGGLEQSWTSMVATKEVWQGVQKKKIGDMMLYFLVKDS